MQSNLDRRLSVLEVVSHEHRRPGEMSDSELMTMVLRTRLGVQPSVDMVRSALQRLEAITDAQLASLRVGQCTLMEVLNIGNGAYGGANA